MGVHLRYTGHCTKVHCSREGCCIFKSTFFFDGFSPNVGFHSSPLHLATSKQSLPLSTQKKCLFFGDFSRMTTCAYGDYTDWGSCVDSVESRSRSAVANQPAACVPQTETRACEEDDSLELIVIVVCILLVLLLCFIAAIMWWFVRPRCREDSASSSDPTTPEKERTRPLYDPKNNNNNNNTPHDDTASLCYEDGEDLPEDALLPAPSVPSKAPVAKDCCRRLVRKNVQHLTLVRPRYVLLDADILATKELVACSGRFASIVEPHLHTNIVAVNDLDTSQVSRSNLARRMRRLTKLVITFADLRKGRETKVLIEKGEDEPLQLLLREKIILQGCKPHSAAASAGLQGKEGMVIHSIGSTKLHTHKDLMTAIDQCADKSTRLTLCNDHAFFHLAWDALKRGDGRKEDARHLGEINRELAIPPCCLIEPAAEDIHFLEIPKSRGSPLGLKFLPTLELLGLIPGGAAEHSPLHKYLHYNIVKIGDSVGDELDTHTINEQHFYALVKSLSPLVLTLRNPLTGDKRCVQIDKKPGEEIGVSIKGKIILTGSEGCKAPGVARFLGKQCLTMEGVALRGADSLEEALRLSGPSRLTTMRFVNDHAIVHLKVPVHMDTVQATPLQGPSTIEAYMTALSLPHLGVRLHRKGYELPDVTDALLQSNGATLLERSIVTAALRLDMGLTIKESSPSKPSFKSGSPSFNTGFSPIQTLS